MKNRKYKKGMVVGLLILLIGAVVVPSMSGMNINLNNTSKLILRPNAAGIYNQHRHDDGSPGDSNNYKEVNEVTADDDSSYVYEDSSEGKPDDNYDIPDHTTETGDIYSVTVYVRAKGGHHTWLEISLWIGGTHYRGNIESVTYDWKTFSFTWTSNPSTGVAWTWNDIDALEIGMRSESAGDGDDVKITTVWVEINYQQGNKPPNKPAKPSGTTSGKTGTSYPYTTSAIDPDGDNVKYGWDWDGDGTADEWTGFYSSGTTISTSHSWGSDGTYKVKVIAEDTNGAQSDWSDPLSVSMPRNRGFNRLFLNFLHQYPILYQLLQRLANINDLNLQTFTIDLGYAAVRSYGDYIECVPTDNYNLDVGEGATVTMELRYSIQAKGVADYGSIEIVCKGIEDSANSEDVKEGTLSIDVPLDDCENFKVRIRCIYWGIGVDESEDCYSHGSTLCVDSPEIKLYGDGDFGTVDTGSESTCEFTLTNIGGKTANDVEITVTGSAFSSPQDGEEFSVDPGEEISIDVTFTPTAKTPYTGNLKAKGSNCNEVNIALEGVGDKSKSKSCINTPFLNFQQNFLENHPMLYQLLQQLSNL